MKKKLLLLIAPLFLTIGCGETTSSERVETEEGKLLNQLIQVDNLTEIRKSVTITKDNVKYYDYYELSYFDEQDGLIYVNSRTNKYNDLSTPLLTSTITDEVYYDGLYSYTLESDNVYYKESNKREIKFFNLDYDFSKLDNLKIEEKEYKKILTGEVNEENINAFFKKTKDKISEVIVSSTNNDKTVERIDISYINNGYKVTEYYNISQFAKDLTLPKLIRTK